LTSAEPECVVDDLEGANSPLMIKLLKEMDSTTRPIEETFREIDIPESLPMNRAASFCRHN
jgi:hypothetical protein